LFQPFYRAQQVETSADVALLFWILAILFFGLGDIVSSFMVFSGWK
jgi:hypothetical protein